MTEGVIYCFTNKLNNKSYIGQTIDEKMRYYRHLTLGDHGTLIDKAIKKYGIDNFDYQIIERVSDETKEEVRDKLNDLEKEYISKYNSISPNGYNLTTGGGQSETCYSEESKAKMRKYQSTRPPISEETRRKMSEVRKGRKYSEEWRRHISEGQKGRKLSEEQKKQISEFLKGRKQDPEVVRKRAEKLKGKRHTEEVKKKMAESQKKKWERIKSDPNRYEEVINNMKNHKSKQYNVGN